jgi:deoxyadenosine/deoxycytidine kinase
MAKIDNLLAKMSDMDSQTIRTDFLGMLYGPSGTGKTTLAMLLAQKLRGDGNVLYLDSSDGWVSLRNIPALMKNTSRFPIESSAELPALATALMKRQKGYENFNVVVIDEVSSIANEVLEAVVREATGTPTDQELPEIEGKHYLPMTRIVSSIIGQFHKVPNLHVILVAHDREKVDHRKVTVVSPSFSPLLLKELQRRMHVTSYVTAEAKNVAGDLTYVREVQSQPTKLVEAKSRIGGMPVKTDFGTWTDIIAGWVHSDDMHTDINSPEPKVEIVDDEIPSEDIPLSDDIPQGDDDAPVFSE